MTAPKPHLPYGIARTVAPGVRCLIAPNPSPLTGAGTNTYLIGTQELALIDPGPNLEDHAEAILNALEPDQAITHIFVTHAHRDHSEGVARLKQTTGATVYAFGDARAGRSAQMEALAAEGVLDGGEGMDANFAPDVSLEDGETVHGHDWSLTAYWTPGHFGNHMSFAFEDTVFSGDLVMGWATSLVSPPDGDLSAFLSSCAKLRDTAAERFLPGHGAAVDDPNGRIDALVSHRQAREKQILAALHAGPGTKEDITARVYTDVPKHLWPAASRNVLAHLVHLFNQGKVVPQGPLTSSVVFALV